MCGWMVFSSLNLSLLVISFCSFPIHFLLSSWKCGVREWINLFPPTYEFPSSVPAPGGPAAWMNACSLLPASLWQPLLRGPEPPAEPNLQAACLSLSLQTYCTTVTACLRQGCEDVAPEGDSLKEGAVGTYSICQGQLVGSTPGAFNLGGGQSEKQKEK